MSPVRKNRKRTSRGFTLIELIVSLAAGLLVAMSVVALSSDATQTFHEEARTAAAEMDLRIAMDRFRSDAQRAGFMATGNIQRDNSVPLDQTKPRYPVGSPQGLRDLAAVRLHYEGSKATASLSSNAGNTFAPDAIDLSGNFTTADEYPVQSVQDPGPNCGGQKLVLSREAAAMYRVRASTDPSTTLKKMFQPVDGQTFLVRIADDLGRYEFHVGCTTRTAGFDGDNPTASPYVELAPTSRVDLSGYGFIGGRITVNPVQTVRWEIRNLDATNYPTYATLAQDATRYSLIRSYIGLDGVAMKPPELVADYAVNMDIAFTADIGTYPEFEAKGGGAPSPLPVTYPFRDARNKSIALPASDLTVTNRPQRIRSILVRLSTRSAVPDRTQPMLLPDKSYPLRYCARTKGCNKGARDWARLRTLTSEVSLPNLARALY